MWLASGLSCCLSLSFCGTSSTRCPTSLQSQRKLSPHCSGTCLTGLRSRCNLDNTCFYPQASFTPPTALPTLPLPLSIHLAALRSAHRHLRIFILLVNSRSAMLRFHEERSRGCVTAVRAADARVLVHVDKPVVACMSRRAHGCLD